MVFLMQNKKQSFIESCTNIIVGSILSILITDIIGGYVLGITITYMQNLWLTLILTVVSIGRSYFVRRTFNYLNERGKHEINK